MPDDLELASLTGFELVGDLASVVGFKRPPFVLAILVAILRFFLQAVRVLLREEHEIRLRHLLGVDLSELFWNYRRQLE
jgi:hypothetical protein